VKRLFWAKYLGRVFGSRIKRESLNVRFEQHSYFAFYVNCFYWTGSLANSFFSVADWWDDFCFGQRRKTKINLLLLSKVSIHPEFMQRPFFACVSAKLYQKNTNISAQGIKFYMLHESVLLFSCRDDNSLKWTIII
jgi:hypothetical protein